MNLEDELRAALRREDPSLGFAKRVVARAQSSAKASRAIPRMIWAMAARSFAAQSQEIRSGAA